MTNLTVTEKLYDAALLNPTHVEAQIGLRVLTAEELKCIHGPLGTLARTAYGYSQALRQTRARQRRQRRRVDHRDAPDLRMHACSRRTADMPVLRPTR